MEGIQMRDTDTYRGTNADPTSQTPLSDESAKHEKKRFRLSYRPTWCTGNTLLLALIGLIIVILLVVVIALMANITKSNGNIAGSDSAQVKAGTGKITQDRNTPGNSLVDSLKNIVIGVRQDDMMQDCQTGSLKKTFPDIDYSFYGYNILKGYPLADGRDPGFTRPLFKFDFSEGHHTADCRFSLPKGLIAAPDVACRTSFASSTVENSRDLRKSLDTSAHVSGGGWGVSFSASTEYKQASSSVETGKYKIIFSTADCKYYFSKLNELELPEFSTEMMEWLTRLNKSISATDTVDDNLLYDFVEYFGTHYASEMVYGASFTYQSSVESSKYEKMKSSELSVEAKASYSGLFSVGGGFGLSKKQQEAASEFQENSVTTTISIGAPPPYNGDAMTWASTVKDTPVPVDYQLKPIHELFNEHNDAVTRYFSPSKIETIRNKILGISSRYCRMLGKKGSNVQCNDDSILKVKDYAMKSLSRNRVIMNLTLDACIDECLKRKDCNIVSFHSDTFVNASTKVPNTCLIENTFFKIEELERYSNAITFIDRNSMKKHFGLKGLRYALSTPRVNEMEIVGAKDFDTLNDYCALACSANDRCVGYETSLTDYYKYNCAMYREHSEVLIKTAHFNFETYIMPKLSKESFKSQRLMIGYQLTNVTLVSPELKTVSIHCESECCEQNCTADPDCLAFSVTNNTCRILTNKNYKGQVTLAQLYGTLTKIYVERSEFGWLNFTSSQSLSLEFERFGFAVSNYSGDSNADTCASRCVSNISCIAASWGDKTCVAVWNSMKTAEQANITVSSTLTPVNNGFQLMIPTYLERIKLFKLDN